MIDNVNEISDELIIKLYMDNPDIAIEYTEKKYGKLCYKLISNYLKISEDAEECYNDFLLNMWKTIPNHPPDNLKAFSCKVARNHAIKKMEYNHSIKRNYPKTSFDELCDYISDVGNAEKEFDGKYLSEQINTFLLEIPEIDRIIFIKRFFFGETVKAISKEVDIPSLKISNMLFKIKKKLHTFLNNSNLI